jgi:hypothetical protein
MILIQVDYLSTFPLLMSPKVNELNTGILADHLVRQTLCFTLKATQLMNIVLYKGRKIHDTRERGGKHAKIF